MVDSTFEQSHRISVKEIMKKFGFEGNVVSFDVPRKQYKEDGKTPLSVHEKKLLIKILSSGDSK